LLAKFFLAKLGGESGYKGAFTVDNEDETVK